MYSYKYRLVFLPFALDECEVLQTVALLTEGDESEMSVFGRHVHLFANLDERLFLQTIGYHILDGDDFHVPLLCQLHELGQTGHCAVFIHYLHQCSCRIEVSHLTEVDGGFGMSATTQHTIVLSI